MKKLLPLVFSVFLVFSCGMGGKVYVAIHWFDHSTSHQPDSITTTLSCFTSPMDLTVSPLPFVPGAYYQTYPGTYDFTATYGVTDRSTTFTIKEAQPVLGSENVYYDIICCNDRTPIVHKVPTF